MEEKVITCVTCPLGCAITVRGEGGAIESLAGENCKRGIEYARNEFLHPQRILTSLVRVTGSEAPLVSVRSDRPIPKDRMFDIMDEVRGAVAAAPVHIGQILLADVCGTGANIVATADA